MDAVEVTPLEGIGYSNASLKRVRVVTRGFADRTFVLKHTHLDGDWTARRTDDAQGRERVLVLDPAFAGVVGQPRVSVRRVRAGAG